MSRLPFVVKLKLRHSRSIYWLRAEVVVRVNLGFISYPFWWFRVFSLAFLLVLINWIVGTVTAIDIDGWTWALLIVKRDEEKTNELLCYVISSRFLKPTSAHSNYNTDPNRKSNFMVTVSRCKNTTVSWVLLSWLFKINAKTIIINVEVRMYYTELSKRLFVDWPEGIVVFIVDFTQPLCFCFKSLILFSFFNTTNSLNRSGSCKSTCIKERRT